MCRTGEKRSRSLNVELPYPNGDRVGNPEQNGRVGGDGDAASSVVEIQGSQTNARYRSEESLVQTNCAVGLLSSAILPPALMHLEMEQAAGTRPTAGHKHRAPRRCPISRTIGPRHGVRLMLCLFFPSSMRPWAPRSGPAVPQPHAGRTHTWAAARWKRPCKNTQLELCWSSMAPRQAHQARQGCRGTVKKFPVQTNPSRQRGPLCQAAAERPLVDPAEAKSRNGPSIFTSIQMGPKHETHNLAEQETSRNRQMHGCSLAHRAPVLRMPGNMQVSGITATRFLHAYYIPDTVCN